LNKSDIAANLDVVVVAVVDALAFESSGRLRQRVLAVNGEACRATAKKNAVGEKSSLEFSGDFAHNARLLTDPPLSANHGFEI